MTIEQAKSIAIAEYLQSCGITPVRVQGNSLWYLSPLRTESEPSFKVSQSRNEWYDFGLGKGGDIVSLAMQLHGTGSVAYALNAIGSNAPNLKPLSFSFRQRESFDSFEDITVKPLGNAALLQFLAERQIPASLAKQACQEVYYKHNGKPYFAIAFGNEQGGYELRNRYFKGCFAPKAVTAIQNGATSCCLFEGFMDYLSYMVLKQRNNPAPSIVKERDYFVLNSTNNTPKLLDRLSKYEQIYCYLDNDEAGMRTTLDIQQRYGVKVSDQSVHYREYKDLNDYLCGKRLTQSAELTQQTKPTKQTEPPKKKSRSFRM